MGDFAKPRIDTFDPTSQAAKSVQDKLVPFLQAFAQNPAIFAQNLQNPAIGQAGNAMAGMLNNNPEIMAFQQALGLEKPMTFQNQFSELGNPFGDLGAVNRAEQTLMSALPMFDRNLQAGLRAANTSAPNRFSSRLAEEGRDITTQALQDYNLFANNALMQGQQLQSQERNNALNFMLGARGLQQGAVDQTNQANLQGRNLGIQGAGMLGQLAANAGNNPFQRAMGLGQFGIDATASVINPSMQFLQGMMGFAQPQQNQAIVGRSPMDYVTDMGKTAATAAIMAGSSIDFKEDVRPYKDARDALAKVENLNLYRWRYKGEPHEHVGVIVEDESTPPEVIQGKAINLYDMLSVLTAAVQALAEDVRQLKEAA